MCNKFQFQTFCIYENGQFKNVLFELYKTFETPKKKFLMLTNFPSTDFFVSIRKKLQLFIKKMI